MPFNQQMTVPVELTLRTTDEGIRMFAEPVKELAGIRRKHYTVKSMQDTLPELTDASYEIDVTIELNDASFITFDLGNGFKVLYYAGDDKLCAINPRASRCFRHKLSEDAAERSHYQGGEAANHRSPVEI